MKWIEENQSLNTRLVFRDFAEAFAFMQKVAEICERQQYHPDWCNQWNTVQIRLQTHDAGNIVTEKDHKLAKAISELYAQLNPKDVS